MIQHRWVNEGGKYIVCVDSYENSEMKGRILSSSWEMETFSSLTQFLLKMEEMLDYAEMPQAFTEPRRFPGLLQPEKQVPAVPDKKENTVIFELKVVFRQHTSWQGILIWQDRQMEHNFRSVLELVILMDSALRSVERSGRT